MESITNLNLLNAIWIIWKELSKKRRIQVILLFILMLICGAAELISLASVIPFLVVLTEPSRLTEINQFNYILDIFKIKSQSEILIFTTIIFGLASLFTMVIRLSNLYLNGLMSANIGSELSNKVYVKTLFKPYLWHISVNTSELINDAINNVGFTVFFIKSFLTLSTQICVATSLLAGLLIIDGFSAIISGIVFSSTYLILAFFVRSKFEDNGRFMVRANEKQLKNLQEGYGSIREVILDNLQFKLLKSYKAIDYPNRIKQAQNEFLRSAPRFALEAISLLLISSLALMLSFWKGSSSTVLTTLGTLALGSQKLLPAMQGIYSDWAGLRNFYPGVISVLKVISTKKNKLLEIKENEKINFERDINLKNITFSYEQNNKKTVLDTINLTIKKGQKIGIIGKTGSGKSTLVDLIMGLLVPNSGSVEIDGKELNYKKEKELAKWRRNISHVPQTIFLSDSSLTENIAFGVDKKNIDMERISQSAKNAEILDFIMNLPSRFDTYIGERGVRLSGGQRQRIGIARALYKSSKIIIFDEATSALDNKTEQKVMECFDNLINEKITVILIAHRLSTLKNCDVVFEVSNSKVNRVDLKNV